MKRITIVLAIAALILSVPVHSQNVGETAPNFTYQTLSGGSWTLSEHSGKVISIFVFGFNCGFCLNAGATLQKTLGDAYDGVENYISIAIDVWDGSTAAVQQFQNTTSMTMPILVNGSAFASLYDIQYDRLIVIDAEGKLAHKGAEHANSDRFNAIEVINEKLGENAPTAINFSSTGESLEVGLYPNPANEKVSLEFDLPSPGLVSVQIIGIDGRIVFNPVSENFVQGSHSLQYNVNELSPGMYYALVTHNDVRKSIIFIVE